MKKLVAIACFGAFITLGISGASLGPTLASIAAAAALPLASSGIIPATARAGAFFAVLVSGRLLDRVDPRLILLPGALLMAAGALGLAFGGNLAFMLVGAVMLGVGSAIFDIGPNFLIGALFTSNAAMVMAALHTIYGLGASAGPQVVNWALAHGDWRAAYVVVALLCTAIGLFFVMVTRPIKRSPPGVQAEISGLASSAVQWSVLLPLLVMSFMYNGAGAGIGDWLYTHLRLTANATVEAASSITSLYWLALTAGRVVSIFALRFLTDMRVLALALALAAIGAMLIVFGRAELIPIGVALLGGGFGPVYPIVLAIGGRQQPEARGTVTGMMVGAGFIGGIVIPVVQGWIGGGQNGGMIITLAATVVLVGAFVRLTANGTSPQAAPL